MGTESSRKLSFLTVIAILAVGTLAVVQIVGAFLPWGTGRVLFFSQTVDGFDLDGEITLGIAVSVLVVLAAHLVFKPDRRLTFGYTLLAGLANIGVVIWQRTKLETYRFVFGPVAVEITPEVNAEEGLIMTAAAAAAAVVISAGMLVVSYRRPGWMQMERDEPIEQSQQ